MAVAPSSVSPDAGWSEMASFFPSKPAALLVKSCEPAGKVCRVIVLEAWLRPATANDWPMEDRVMGESTVNCWGWRVSGWATDVPSTVVEAGRWRRGRLGARLDGGVEGRTRLLRAWD